MHFSVSTKPKDRPGINSESYTYERDIWRIAEEKFRLSELANISRSITFDESLSSFFSKNKVILWGAGTISEAIFLEFGSVALAVFSGLKEEAGNSFYGYPVCTDVSTFDFDDVYVLCTVEKYSASLISFLNYEGVSYKGLFEITVERMPTEIRYGLKYVA